MAKSPRISDAEWRIMQLLWARSPQTAAEIADKLAPDTGWNPKTTQTLINRLVRKGALAYHKRGRAHHFYPKVKQNQCVRDASRSFLHRVFRGELAPMLARFIEEADLSPADIEHLKQILEKKEQ